jgi:hypothetical protein
MKIIIYWEGLFKKRSNLILDFVLFLLLLIREEMNKSTSQLSLSSYCHNISAENYFLSPKMPVKDHSLAFRSTIMTPKHASSKVPIF